MADLSEDLLEAVENEQLFIILSRDGDDEAS